LGLHKSELQVIISAPVGVIINPVKIYLQRNWKRLC